MTNAEQHSPTTGCGRRSPLIAETAKLNARL